MFHRRGFGGGADLSLIYKICHKAEWAQAVRERSYAGSAKDREDGFIHFSTAVQLPGTLAKYYTGADELVLAAVDAATLGPALRYEPSRDGALFPHLYGTLPLSSVRWTKPIIRGADGVFVLPEECV
jgi:uncharacterized protein (DUF952 family)